MTIPTEPIGSIPRPPALIDALLTSDGADPSLETLYDEAIRDTIERFEATGSPVITDGEQRKYHNFGTYCVHGLLQHPSGRLQDFIRRRAHAPLAAAHLRAVSLQEVCGLIPHGRKKDRAGPGQAGRDLAVRAQPDVSRRGNRRLPPGGIHRRPPEGARDGGPPMPRRGGPQGPGRLHGGTPRGQDRPVGRTLKQLHRPQQHGALQVLRGGAPKDRDSHLPRW